MARRSHWVERPGTDGVVTDLPAHQLPLRALERGGDAIMPNGLIRQRRGWAYDGTVADAAANLIGIWRAKFILADETRTLTSGANLSIYIHNGSSAGTRVAEPSPGAIPRCVYNDELIFCSQDGHAPITRYSGAAFQADNDVSAATLTSGVSTLTATVGTWDAAVVPGAYIQLQPDALAEAIPLIYARVIERISSTVITLEGIKSSATETAPGDARGHGYTFPCVAVYNAGTGSFDNANDEFEGTGTVWTGGDWGGVLLLSDALLTLPDTGDARVHQIASATSPTVLDLGTTAQTATNLNYAILRPCPFKDVAAHKGSFWGTGVAQFTSRVYVGPVGWNLSFPPGATLPFDPAAALTSENAKDFLMDFVDVPAPNDADECVALLPSPNPLIVAKRKAAYGIYGVHGGLDVALLPGGAGAGCIDIRSAWELSIGPVWAGTAGVHAFIGGRVVTLTDGRIEREWQALTEDFDYGTLDYCAIGEKDGRLVVHLTTAGGTIQRTWHCYPYDDQGKLNPRWLDRVSNFSPRFMFSSKVEGEEEKILAVQNADQGRVINYGPALDGTGTARDADGTSPALDLRFSSRLARDAGANVDERVLQVAVEANLYDTAGSASTLGGSVVSSQALDSDSTVTTALSSMASKNADLTKPYVHTVGVKAGLHQLQLLKSATAATEQTTEITRVGVTVRASRRPL